MWQQSSEMKFKKYTHDIVSQIRKISVKKSFSIQIDHLKKYFLRFPKLVKIRREQLK